MLKMSFRAPKCHSTSQVSFQTPKCHFRPPNVIPSVAEESQNLILQLGRRRTTRLNAGLVARMAPRLPAAGFDSSASLGMTMALRRPRKTMKMRPSFHRRSGAGRSPGAGARFPTQGRTEGIGSLQFVFITMTLERS